MLLSLLNTMDQLVWVQKYLGILIPHSDYNVNMGSKINMNCKNLDINFGYKIREEILYGGLLTAVADEIHTIQTMKRILFQTDEIVG